MKKSFLHILKNIIFVSFSVIFAGAVISFCILQKQNAEKTFFEEDSLEKNLKEEIKPSKVELKKFTSLQDDDIFHESEYQDSYVQIKYYYSSFLILQIHKGHINSIYSPPRLLS